MTDLVTFAEAKLYCRIDGDAEDATLALMIAAASEAVRDIVAEIDPEETPVRVKLAVLTRVAIMFDNRDSLAAGKDELLMLSPLRAWEL